MTDPKFFQKCSRKTIWTQEISIYDVVNVVYIKHIVLSIIEIVNTNNSIIEGKLSEISINIDIYGARSVRR